MLTENEAIVVKKGIEKGYDLEMLSAEFEVPIDELLKMKQELFASKTANKVEIKTDITPIIQTKSNPVKKINAIRKMEEIRKRYYQIFFASSNNSGTKELTKENTPEENAIIQEVIEKVKKQIEELPNCNSSKAKYQVKDIHLTLKELKTLNLSVKQGKILVDLVQHKNLSVVSSIREAFLREAFYSSKKMVFSKFASAISNAAHTTEDIEELKKLNKILPIELVEQNNMILGPVKRFIFTKINNVQQKNILNNMGSNISPELSVLVTEICNGKVSKRNAQNVILEECNKMQSNQFLKDSQKREQILIKIRSIIKMNPEKFEIQNGQKTLKIIQDLTDCDSDVALECVVLNFIGRKKYSEAKKICDDQLENVEQDNLNKQKNIGRIRRKIIVAEIGDLILKGIKREGTPEEESAYIQMVEENLRKASISLSNVDLGKSQDGKRRITLADIWDERTR